MSAEDALLDTNILIYATYRDSPHHEASQALMARAAQGEFRVCLSPQIIFEYFSAVTNPRRFKPALTPQECAGQIETFLRSGWRMLLPGPTMTMRAIQMARDAGVKGGDIYDAALAATALDNGVSLLYTANTADFQFPGLRAVNPLRG